MENQLYHSKKWQAKNSNLIIFSFATAFFPRIIESAGAPSVINFAHFLIVPFLSFTILLTTQIKDKIQVFNIKLLVFLLFCLFWLNVASALFNYAGIINLVLEYMLLAEPFIFLTALLCIKISYQQLLYFKRWILSFAAIHILLAFFQYLFLKLGILKLTDMTMSDNVQGVFYLSGGGHTVGASVATSFGLYFFFNQKNFPFWFRFFVLISSFLELLFADAKQVLLVWLISWSILIITKIHDLRKTILYLISASIIIFLLIWCIQNLELFRAFNTWIRPGLYGPDGEATQQKILGLKIISKYHQSPINWLLGLGPGHTIGRLGGWMLEKYSDLLLPLGATIHPVTQEIMNAYEGTWLDSSFFSPMFGWAGIWGDLGWLGLGAYLSLFFVVWNKFCLDDFSKILLLTVCIHGFILTQMEEPGYVLSVMIIIGLKWHEYYTEIPSKS